MNRHIPVVLEAATLLTAAPITLGIEGVAEYETLKITLSPEINLLFPNNKLITWPIGSNVVIFFL